MIHGSILASGLKLSTLRPIFSGFFAESSLGVNPVCRFQPENTAGGPINQLLPRRRPFLQSQRHGVRVAIAGMGDCGKVAD